MSKDPLERIYPKWNCPTCGDWFHMPYKYCKCDRHSGAYEKLAALEAENAQLAIGDALWRARDPYGIEKQLEERVKELEAENAKLREAVEAAKAYETYLPNMEPVGAARFSDALVKAMNLRKALAALEPK